MKTLYIIRGLPGSGKSTLARTLCGHDYHEADQYFMEEGVYKFDPAKLKEAHAWCLDQVRKDLEFGLEKVGVSNTFTQAWELRPYQELALEFGYNVFILACENSFGNIHGVPDEAMLRMAKRWEPMQPDVRLDWELSKRP